MTDSVSRMVKLRRVPMLIIVCALVFVVLYVAVVLLYARGVERGGVADLPDVDADIGATEAVGIVLTPVEVDAATDRLTFEVSFTDTARTRLVEGEGAGGDVRVVLTSTGGSSTLTFAAGKLDVPQQVRLPTNGEIEAWPFDRHAAIAIATVEFDSTESETTTLLGLLAHGEHHATGWVVSVNPMSEFADDPSAALIPYEIEARRSTATIAFGFVLLALMVILPVLGLTVAIMALRGRRKIEVGFFTWSAGMLFATPMLRNFLPGQPPVGSWVDYLVVLWVIAGLILALLIFVVAWYRWGEPQPEAVAAQLEKRARRASSAEQR